jgi:AcrR family transcriptional regulator
MLAARGSIQKMSRPKLYSEEGTERTDQASYAGRSPQALKSERTRAELLRAAEMIFARDGFEASRIGDIAAEAGRSRGAFYANFANKTEVFLALRSVATRRRARELRERIEHVKDETARYDAIIRHVVEQICDTQTQLLQIEFKLFALRHPEMLAELAEKHLEASTSINRQELSDLFPEKNERLAEMRCNTLAIEALLEGFALNALFSPKVLDASSIQQMVPQLLEQLFHRPKASRSASS